MKQKMREISIKTWENPLFRKRMSKLRKGRHHTEEIKRKIRICRLKQLFPLKDTLIELRLQNKLTELNILFEKHKTVIGQPDIFIQPNICIFADGCYWHGCEQCYDKNKMSSWIKQRKAADILITQKLQNEGYVVLRFWEHDIKNNLDECFSFILAKLASTTNQALSSIVKSEEGVFYRILKMGR